MNFARPLTTPIQVEEFLKMISFDDDEVVSSIVEVELTMNKFDFTQQTDTYTTYREKICRNNIERWKRRKDIVEEILSEKRLASDEEIEFGKGGGLPKTALKKDKKAFIIIGLPASGKSGIANIIADKKGAIILDSDYIKRKLPEYSKYNFGASLVHKESIRTLFGYRDDDGNRFKSAYEYCVEQEYNIVIPKIGNTYSSVLNIAIPLQEKGYKVHLTLVELDRAKATWRAVYRFKNTKRYVPLGVIFDDFCNDSVLTYYYLKCNYKKLFSSFGAISTDVVQTEKPKFIDSERNNPSNLFK